jgi:general secretion pathway protein E
VERPLKREEATALGVHLHDGADSVKVYEGKGCNLCRNTGLVGRIGIFEILPITDAIRQLIHERADAPKLNRTARREGMMTLREAAIRRMLDGETTFAEVLRVTAETPG